MFLATVSEKIDLIEVASSGVSGLDRHERQLVDVLGYFGSPDVPTLIIGAFGIIMIAVAYMVIGIILFTLFGDK